MWHIGITGGIGSGKTAFCRMWQELGVHVEYTDSIARMLMTENPELRKSLAREFGPEIYCSDGSLNHEWLGREAFINNRISDLNRIVHPSVWRELARRKQQAIKDGHDLFAHESIYLPEKKDPVRCDAIILLRAGEQIRAQRVGIRNRSDPDQVYKIMNHQAHLADYAGRADHVICNNGSLSQLEKEAKKFFSYYKTIAKSSV